MLPKINRLKKKEVEFIFKNGKTYKEGFFLFKIVKRKESSPPSFSVIVPKKVSKKVVERNKIKRRIREALRKEIFHIQKGVSGIFIALPEIKNKDYWEIKKNVEKIIKNSKIKK